ncbi:uncharacterized protein TRAVEDRAFT_74308 [Trametes versicolor FP-101664 SS1]|uniref:uncharacterized protein n=1 Tax=Trametes versicolor (strain FP-101664) TaxID=717944 RepID=UPI0004621BE2|nr:uncharacterized protein TRAVEDRAFT_74308 [Trametes versicolor FP-101664 SS1]EIW53996.1 hypothetical protein TRAVEDRAFT_74308 [Trametes versicolor FP-101664 SS1]
MAHTRASDRMLSIPHLWEEVFIHLAPQTCCNPGANQISGREKPPSNSSYAAKEGQRALARSARVCKAFAEPALDVLWRELDDLLVLLRILPPFQPYTSRYFSILEEVTPAQWLRFQSYARRVRVLSGKAFKSAMYQVDKMVWTALERLCKDQPLLPNLQILSSPDLKNEYLTLLTLLAPSLHSLVLSFPESEIDHDAVYARTRPSTRGVFLQLLIPRCQRLTELSIDSGLKNLPAKFITSFTRLDKLVQLNLVYSGAVADYPTLQSISQMTALRDLTLEISLDRSVKSAKLPPLGGAFLDLEKLQLSGNIADLHRVFEACECPQLSELALSISGKTTVDTLQDGLDMVCSRVSTSVTELSLFVSAKISSPKKRTDETSLFDRSPITWQPAPLVDILRPFLAFHELDSVSVEFDHYAPRMNDEDARAFSHAWPALTLFHLRFDRSSLNVLPGNSNIITIGGLGEFAQGCPQLEVLNLPVLDIRPTPLLGTAPGQKALYSLSIHEFLGGREANLLDVAVALDLLFPSLGKRPDVTMDGSIVPDVINADSRCQPARVVMLLVGAMWARREHEQRNLAIADGDDFSWCEEISEDDADDASE